MVVAIVPNNGKILTQPGDVKEWREILGVLQKVDFQTASSSARCEY